MKPLNYVRNNWIAPFRLNTKDEIEIGRVLHDSMDLASNLPDGYLA
jgi:plasmid stabilization system protein ParE